VVEPIFSFYETWYAYPKTSAHLKGIIHKFLSSVSVSIWVPLVFARQQLDRNVTAAMNTRALIGELLVASPFMRSLCHEKKLGDYFFSELLVK
jgi:hypothetical protein